MFSYQISNFSILHFKRKIKTYAEGIGREFILFSVSTVSFQASRFIVALIVARWVGPEQYGIWNALQPLLTYSVIVFCGIPNGLNREIPFLAGKGEVEEAQKLINFSLLFVLTVSCFLGFIIMFTSLLSGIPNDVKSPLRVAGLLFVTMNLYVLFQFLLKSRIRFQAMSAQQFIFTFLYPAITLICAFWGKISGFMLGQALSAFIMVLIIYRIEPFPIRIEFSWNHFKKLSRIGMPLMGAGVLYGLLTTVDRWIILANLGIDDLGQYTVAILVFGIVSIVPVIISQQMYPRIAFRYGETGDLISLLPMIAKQSFSAFGVTLPIIIITYLLVPHFVTTFMPQYSQGVWPSRILLIGVLFLPIAGGVANFLNTVDKQLYYMIVQAAAVIINIAIATIFVRYGWGLIGVAWAGAITYFLYSFILGLTGYMIILKKVKFHKSN
jgi:O-antigen/teichoic acid export membrane protein